MEREAQGEGQEGTNCFLRRGCLIILNDRACSVGQLHQGRARGESVVDESVCVSLIAIPGRFACRGVRLLIRAFIRAPCCPLHHILLLTASSQNTTPFYYPPQIFCPSNRKIIGIIVVLLLKIVLLHRTIYIEVLAVPRNPPALTGACLLRLAWTQRVHGRYAARIQQEDVSQMGKK